MSAEGGAAVVLARPGRSYAWGDDGAIYFAQGGVVYRWSPGSADAEQVVALNGGPDRGLRDVLPGSSAALTEVTGTMYAVDFETGLATELGPGVEP